MKIPNLVYVVAALLLGLVLGNWSVQSDLRKARKEIGELKEQLAASGNRGNGLQGITSLLRVPSPTPATTDRKSVV